MCEYFHHIVILHLAACSLTMLQSTQPWNGCAAMMKLAGSLRSWVDDVCIMQFLSAMAKLAGSQAEEELLGQMDCSQIYASLEMLQQWRFPGWRRTAGWNQLQFLGGICPYQHLFSALTGDLASLWDQHFWRRVDRLGNHQFYLHNLSNQMKINNSPPLKWGQFFRFVCHQRGVGFCPCFCCCSLCKGIHFKVGAQPLSSSP